MPELPEVERVRRALQPVMEGARFVEVIARRPDLRDALPLRFAARLAGQTVRRLDRRGKYLLAELASGDVLLMHLGMSGSFRIDGLGAAVPLVTYYKRHEALAHDHIVFRMSSGAVVTFNDPRRFGSMDLIDAGALAAHRAVGTLGPEPLDHTFTAAHLARVCHRRKVSLKAALMDQRVVAGLGNIYVCEALWRAGLSPMRAAGTVVDAKGKPKKALVLLTEAIRSVVADAIAAGGSSLRDHIQTDGTLGYFQHSFSVYDRAGEPCRTAGCGGSVSRAVQAGRSTFHCPKCQK
jgi:formamidopyrimidine-DNA glycosylase